MSIEKMGQFIAELRKSRQMTQKELAEKLNITDKAVSKWERGLSYPDISLLRPLAESLGVTPGELLNGERNPETDTAANSETSATIDNVLQFADETVKIKTRTTRMRAVLAVMGFVLIFMSLPLARISNWQNTRSSQAMARLYDLEVARLLYERREYIDEHFRRAEEYNEQLQNLQSWERLTRIAEATASEEYLSILNVNRTMGRLEIPVIDVNLPIFHTSDHEVLARGVGHMVGTAFPIGGYGNHPVLGTFSDFVGAALFRDLHELNIGDIFFISVLDRRLAYEVTNISIILPNEIEALDPVPGEDIVTLLTDTPHRINTHRLLVRGTRIQYIPYFAEEIE